MTDNWKSWHEWQPDGPDVRSVLAEVSRHMKNGWEHRAKPGSTRFKAAHQLSHKGWKFPSGVVDVADGWVTPSIKALRALIIAGRYDWFERGAMLAPGVAATASEAPTPHEQAALAKVFGPLTPFRRIDIGEAEIWMVAQPDGWRIAIVYVRDMSTSGVKEILQLASATRGGCLVVALAVVTFGFAAARASRISRVT